MSVLRTMRQTFEKMIQWFNTTIEILKTSTLLSFLLAWHQNRKQVSLLPWQNAYSRSGVPVSSRIPHVSFGLCRRNVKAPQDFHSLYPSNMPSSITATRIYFMDASDMAIYSVFEGTKRIGKLLRHQRGSNWSSDYRFFLGNGMREVTRRWMIGK